jgi:hypothetical protein
MLNYAKTKKNDERYTPDYMIYPILKYIKKRKWHGRKNIIWCPFDTENSNFVKILSENNYRVIYSHKKYNQNFFEFEPKKYDLIVSNPPFSKKLAVFERLWKLNKPFAILMCLPCLNYQEIGNFFYHHSGLQLMIFDKKVSFDGNCSSFNTSYFCRKFLKKDLIFETLKDNNTNRFYRGHVGIDYYEEKTLFDFTNA